MDNFKKNLRTTYDWSINRINNLCTDGDLEKLKDAVSIRQEFAEWLLREDTEVQQYPIVSKIEENSEAYNEGLRVGHKIIKLNGHTLEYKDIKTLLSDFTYERKTSDFITLTIL